MLPPDLLFGLLPRSSASLSRLNFNNRLSQRWLQSLEIVNNVGRIEANWSSNLDGGNRTNFGWQPIPQSPWCYTQKIGELLDGQEALGLSQALKKRWGLGGHFQLLPWSGRSLCRTHYSPTTTWLSWGGVSLRGELFGYGLVGAGYVNPAGSGLLGTCGLRFRVPSRYTPAQRGSGPATCVRVGLWLFCLALCPQPAILIFPEAPTQEVRGFSPW